MSSGLPRGLVTALAVAIAGCSDSMAGPTPAAPIAPRIAVSVISVSLPTVYGSTQTDVTPAPSVRVLDASGAALPGVAVTFSVTEGNGSIANSVVMTDAAGTATCSRWTTGAVEGWNTVSAKVSGLAPVAFHVFGLRPEPTGTRYELTLHEGTPVSPANPGILILGSDSTFRLIWTFGLGTSSQYNAVNAGRYARSGSALRFLDFSQNEWASGELQGNVLTFRWDDYLDMGFHYIVVEVFEHK